MATSGLPDELISPRSNSHVLHAGFHVSGLNSWSRLVASNAGWHVRRLKSSLGSATAGLRVHARTSAATESCHGHATDTSFHVTEPVAASTAHRSSLCAPSVLSSGRSTVTAPHLGARRRAAATRATIKWWRAVRRADCVRHAIKTWRRPASDVAPFAHRGRGSSERGAPPSESRVATRMAEPRIAPRPLAEGGTAESQSPAWPPCTANMAVRCQTDEAANTRARRAAGGARDSMCWDASPPSVSSAGQAGAAGGAPRVWQEAGSLAGAPREAGAERGGIAARASALRWVARCGTQRAPESLQEKRTGYPGFSDPESRVTRDCSGSRSSASPVHGISEKFDTGFRGYSCASESLAVRVGAAAIADTHPQQVCEDRHGISGRTPANGAVRPIALRERLSAPEPAKTACAVHPGLT